MDLRKERAPSVGKQGYVYRLTGAVKIITIREMAALVVSASLGDFSHFVWGSYTNLGRAAPAHGLHSSFHLTVNPLMRKSDSEYY
jgi:hypothetical protein